MCGGCDPAPDLRWICSVSGCRIQRWFDSMMGSVFIREPFAHRRSVRAARQIREENAWATARANDGEAQARQEGGLFA